jgi:hypothetical protein
VAGAPSRRSVTGHTLGYPVTNVGGRDLEARGAAAFRDEDDMSSTVPCPECHRPARVLDSFTEQQVGGPVRYLRVQCEGALSFIVSVEDLDAGTPAAPTALDIQDGAA